MYVKIVNHEREESPRRRADLRRLFRYLFTPQSIMEADGGRLLGPPELLNVLVCEFPSGPAIERVADDLAEQFHAYTQEALVCQNIEKCDKACNLVSECRGGCLWPLVSKTLCSKTCESALRCRGAAMPESWYAHMMFSFHPNTLAKFIHPPDHNHHIEKFSSVSSNAIRVVKDCLDFMGWGGTNPTVFVVHGDKAHPHVHVVTTTRVFGGGMWHSFDMTRNQLIDLAKFTKDMFGV